MANARDMKRNRTVQHDLDDIRAEHGDDVAALCLRYIAEPEPLPVEQPARKRGNMFERPSFGHTTVNRHNRTA